MRYFNLLIFVFILHLQVKDVQSHYWCNVVLNASYSDDGNCPDTKMDGDYDGIPCENDSRF